MRIRIFEISLFLFLPLMVSFVGSKAIAIDAAYNRSVEKLKAIMESDDVAQRASGEIIKIEVLDRKYSRYEVHSEFYSMEVTVKESRSKKGNAGKPSYKVVPPVKVIDQD